MKKSRNDRNGFMKDHGLMDSVFRKLIDNGHSQGNA